MGIFEHTASEPGMWRGWLRSGQVLELCWNKRGWSFGGGVHIHGNDDDRGDRMLFLKLWRFTAVIPLGVIDSHDAPGDEPQWSAYFDSESDLVLHWGHRYWFPKLPWQLEWHRTSTMLVDESWHHETAAGNVALKAAGCDPWRTNRDATDGKKWAQEYPYTYVLKSGEVQNRTATVGVEEREWRRRALWWSGIGAKVVRSIEVQFSDEVGERSGSWKGGCVGCGYTLLPGETPEDALRRMERDRDF